MIDRCVAFPRTLTIALRLGIVWLVFDDDKVSTFPIETDHSTLYVMNQCTISHFFLTGTACYSMPSLDGPSNNDLLP